MNFGCNSFVSTRDSSKRQKVTQTTPIHQQTEFSLFGKSSQTKTSSSEPKSLTKTTLNAVAKSIFDGSIFYNSLSVPLELAEGLFGSAKKMNTLDSRTLSSLVRDDLNTLDINNDKNDDKLTPKAIDDALRTVKNVSVLRLHSRQVNPSSFINLANSSNSQSLRVIEASSLTGSKDYSCAIKEILCKCNKLEEIDLNGTPITDKTFMTTKTVTPVMDVDQRNKNNHKRKRSFYQESRMVDLLYDRKKDENDDWDLENTVNIILRSKTPQTQPKKSETHRTPPQVPSTPKRIPPVIPVIPYISLTTIKLSGCTLLTNLGLKFLAESAPLLLSLDCSHNPKITDLTPIFLHCTFIKHINVEGCPIESNPDPSFWSSPSHKPPLQFLEQFNFSGSGLLCADFSRLFSAIASSCKILQLRNKEPDDIDLPALWIQNFRRLEVLDLYGMSVGRSFLSQLLVPRLRESLRELDLSLCDGLDAPSLGLITQFGFPHLLRLSVCFPSEMSDLTAFGRALPRLTHLSVNYRAGCILRPGDVLALARGLPELLECEIWCCSVISLRFVVQFLRFCRRLRKCLLCRVNSDVSVRELPCLSGAEFAVLDRGFPDVEFTIWSHRVKGNRFFQYSGHQRELCARCEIGVERINCLRVEVECSGDVEIFVDGVPIWINENKACLEHLIETVEENCGALPLIADWCCECNLESFNGVLFWHDSEFVHWKTHEPGSKKEFTFAKSDYFSAIIEAVKKRKRLGWLG